VTRAQLFVLGGRDVGRSFDIEDEAVLGRDAGCEVRLADRSISRRHARLAFDGLQWVLEDLGSRNGVKVGGERVESATLVDHDELVLGDLPLRFRLDEADRAQPEPLPEEGDEVELEEEIVLEGEDLEPAPAPVPGRPAAPAPRAPRAVGPAPSELDGTAGGDTSPPREAPPSRLSDRDSRRQELLRESSAGLLRGDLSQQPTWVKGLIALLVVALAVGIVLVVFQAVRGVRETL